MSYGEIMAVCSQIHTTHTHKYTVWPERRIFFFMLKLVVHKVTT